MIWQDTSEISHAEEKKESAAKYIDVRLYTVTGKK